MTATTSAAHLRQLPKPVQDEVLLHVWRALGNAKITEFRAQCRRLARLAAEGRIDRAAAVDRLYEVAVGHALTRTLGVDRIEAIVAEAFQAVGADDGV
jgi:hypothetical protein